MKYFIAILVIGLYLIIIGAQIASFIENAFDDNDLDEWDYKEEDKDEQTE